MSEMGALLPVLASLVFAGTLPVHSQTSASLPPVQNAPTAVSLTSADVKDFGTIVRAVAAQAHVTIVAEDAPLHPTVADDRARALTQPLPLGDLLQQIADAYDYEIVPEAKDAPRPTLILLRKKFTDWHDLPDVTFGECRATMQDVQNFFGPVLPRYPATSRTFEDGLVRDIVDSLAPAHQAALTEKGIAVHDLPLEVQKRVWRFAAYGYLGERLDHYRETTDFLASVEKAGTTRVGQSSESLLLFYLWSERAVYGVAAPENTPLIVFAPCAPVTPEATGAPGNVGSADGMSDKAWLAALGEKRRGTQTLQAIAQNLNDAQANGANALHFAVEPDVAGKHVLVAGSSFTDRRLLFRFVASLLGLRTRQPEPNQYVLCRRVVLPDMTVAPLPGAVGTLLPDALRRYLLNDLFSPNDDFPGSSDIQRESGQARQRHLFAGTTLIQRAELARRLKGKESIAFASLSEPNRDAFALQWIQLHLLAQLSGMSPPPLYVAQFENARIGGTWQGEGEQATFTLAVSARSGGSVESAQARMKRQNL